MKLLKKTAVAVFAVMMAGLYAQTDSSQRTESSAEEEYLTSVEDVVIKELAGSDDRDNKMVALQYLESAVEDGRVSKEMMVALDSLAGEGVNTQSRTGGRLMNNFPDIRAKSCDLLAKVPTEESKTTLVKVALADNEPMVITAAIRSLGEIGLNDGDDVVDTIAWISKKNSVVNPTSSLALEVIIAYEKLWQKAENKANMIQAVSQIATNYNYVTPVRTRALNLLKQIQSSGSSDSRKK
ncbi:MAG: HEAT repeat domain-containing protein [Treponema sp.]|nr:HEAT repeat domain-containing protein [Treponema sp.]